ncbi:MAG: fumarate hydratase [Candidatus Omnitrophica bacterium]|nr:fumarate hydratase [Candidatus Omnitrophota bacterium]MDD5592801.1 fumarate hydratase [Candidatus Omnitrophota bacterium]
MRIIPAHKIRDAVSELCIRANTVLRKDVLKQLKIASLKETNKRAKKILGAIMANAGLARRKRLAICQDTGLPVVFLEIGQEVKISGDLKSAVNRGVESGYKKGYLRNSIINNPLLRGKPGYSPVVIHTEIVRGKRLKITVLPKGFGCENKSQLKMFNPTVDINEIKGFILEAVKSAGPDACPPYIVGVGIGGTADYAMFLAKKALLRKPTTNDQRPTTKLEKDLLNNINKLNIGPMGLGGAATCLGVNIETYPTHIAGLPVAVNISCHALRSAPKTI